jgi:hypothetical protein
MSLNFSFDGLSEITNKLEEMEGKIKSLEHEGLVDETRNWEVQDVHRHRPGAKRMRGGGARVIFRPHSRYEMMKSRRAVRKLFRRGRYIYKRSIRPILRQVMIDRLKERVSELLSEKLKW